MWRECLNDAGVIVKWTHDPKTNRWQCEDGGEHEFAVFRPDQLTARAIPSDPMPEKDKTVPWEEAKQGTSVSIYTISEYPDASRSYFRVPGQHTVLRPVGSKRLIVEDEVGTRLTFWKGMDDNQNITWQLSKKNSLLVKSQNSSGTTFIIFVSSKTEFVIWKLDSLFL